MRILIEYYIWCLNRYLLVEVNEADKTRTQLFMSMAYAEWQNLESDECCEEYICNRLHKEGIEFIWQEKE